MPKKPHSMRVSRVVDLLFDRRFFEDYTNLSPELASKVDAKLDLMRREGPRHVSFHTRVVAGSRDARMHLLNLDDRYRMVGALEGDIVLLQRVTKHDEAITWGETATLDPLAERLTE